MNLMQLSVRVQNAGLNPAVRETNIIDELHREDVVLLCHSLSAPYCLSCDRHDLLKHPCSQLLNRPSQQVSYLFVCVAPTAACGPVFVQRSAFHAGARARYCPSTTSPIPHPLCHDCEEARRRLLLCFESYRFRCGQCFCLFLEHSFCDCFVSATRIRSPINERLQLRFLIPSFILPASTSASVEEGPCSMRCSGPKYDSTMSVKA